MIFLFQLYYQRSFFEIFIEEQENKQQTNKAFSPEMEFESGLSFY